MSVGRRRAARRSTCSTSWTTPSSSAGRRWRPERTLAVRRRARQSQGERRPVHAPARGHDEALLMRDGRRRAGQPPRGADLDRRDPGADRDDRSPSGCVAETPCRVALIDATHVHRPRARARAPSTGGSCARSGPSSGGSRRSRQSRERLASLGTMAAGLAHELNNPAAAARRAAPDLGDALDVLSSTVGRFVEAGIEREQAADLVDLQREALTRAAALHAARRARRRRRRGRAGRRARRRSASRSRGGWPSRWPPRGSTRAWLERVAAAGGPGDRRRAGLGRGLADRARAGRGARRVDRRGCRSWSSAVKAYAYMDRGEVVEADVHEGLETTLVVLGHKLKHTSIEVRARVRPQPAAADRPRVRAQPGLDQPDRQRDRRARRVGHDHDHHAARRRRARWSRSPTTARASPPTCASASSSRSSPRRTSARARASGSTPRTGSSPRPHRGTLRLESEPGRTAFRVWLPLLGTTKGPPGQSGPLVMWGWRMAGGQSASASRRRRGVWGGAIAGDRGSDDPFGGWRERPSQHCSRLCSATSVSQSATADVLPVVAIRTMRCVGWRNLGETLAAR